MAKVVLYSETQPDLRLTKKVPSAHTPAYLVRSNAIINPPSWSLIGSVPFMYLRANTESPPDDIMEMSQAEKDVIDQEVADAEAVALADEKDITSANKKKYLRAGFLVIMDEINLLRAKHALPERTVAQFKNAVDNKYGTLS